MTARQSQRKTNRDGEIQSPMSSIAEHLGDVQPSTIPTEQMLGKEDRMDDYGRELTVGNEASGENNAEQPPDVVKRALEAFKRENPEMAATAFEYGNVVISCEGVVHVNVDVLEKCFDLDRDAVDNLTALQFVSHPVIDTLDAFPAPVHLGEEDYWSFDDVKAWVINYRHACAVRIVSADVSRALAIFAEWRDEKQYPPWCWETIFGGRPNAES